METKTLLNAGALAGAAFIMADSSWFMFFVYTIILSVVGYKHVYAAKATKREEVTSTAAAEMQAVSDEPVIQQKTESFQQSASPPEDDFVKPIPVSKPIVQERSRSDSESSSSQSSQAGDQPVMEEQKPQVESVYGKVQNLLRRSSSKSSVSSSEDEEPKEEKYVEEAKEDLADSPPPPPPAADYEEEERAQQIHQEFESSPKAEDDIVAGYLVKEEQTKDDSSLDIPRQEGSLLLQQEPVIEDPASQKEESFSDMLATEAQVKDKSDLLLQTSREASESPLIEERKVTESPLPEKEAPLLRESPSPVPKDEALMREGSPVPVYAEEVQLLQDSPSPTVPVVEEKEEQLLRDSPSPSANIDSQALLREESPVPVVENETRLLQESPVVGEKEHVKEERSFGESPIERDDSPVMVNKNVDQLFEQHVEAEVQETYIKPQSGWDNKEKVDVNEGDLLGSLDPYTKPKSGWNEEELAQPAEQFHDDLVGLKEQKAESPLLEPEPSLVDTSFNEPPTQPSVAEHFNEDLIDAQIESPKKESPEPLLGVEIAKEALEEPLVPTESLLSAQTSASPQDQPILEHRDDRIEDLLKDAKDDDARRSRSSSSSSSELADPASSSSSDSSDPVVDDASSNKEEAGNDEPAVSVTNESKFVTSGESVEDASGTTGGPKAEGEVSSIVRHAETHVIGDEVYHSDKYLNSETQEVISQSISVAEQQQQQQRPE